jgi:hypothetical protein
MVTPTLALPLVFSTEATRAVMLPSPVSGA